MRSSLFVLPVVFAVCAGACKVSSPATQADHVYGSASDSVFFKLERTPCFGKCAAYSVVVDKNGLAKWVGRSNTDRMGTWTAQMTKADMEKILVHATEIGFFSFEDKYDGQVSDLPSTIVRVNADGKDKRVVGRYKTPPAFKPFADFADSLLAPLAWSKTAPDQ